MKTFAARIAEKGESLETSAMLWNEITIPRTIPPSRRMRGCIYKLLRVRGRLRRNSTRSPRSTRSDRATAGPRLADLVKADYCQDWRWTRAGFVFYWFRPWKATRKLIQRAHFLKSSVLRSKDLELRRLLANAQKSHVGIDYDLAGSTLRGK